MTIKFNAQTRRWELHNRAGVIGSSAQKLVLTRRYPEARVVS